MNERLKKLRKTLDLTQQAFADRIGIARGNVGAYEVKKNSPSDAVISLICREFNVNENWLRTGEGKMFIPDSNDELDVLARKYNLSDGAYILIKKFLDLKKEQQDVIINFVKEAAIGLSETNIPKTNSSQAPDIDIDAEVESYRQRLELQKKATEKLSVSNGRNVI